MITAPAVAPDKTALLNRLLMRYYLGPEHPAKLRFWRWIYKALGRPGVVVHYADQALLQLDYLDYVQSHILKFGFYEPEVWEVLSYYASCDEVVWDIGGHIGSVAVRAALDPRVSSVHTFEPNPRTAAALRANLVLNPSLPITHHAMALGNRTETRTLSPGEEGNVGTASLVCGGAVGIAVACVTADDWLAAGHAPHPTLIKLDVEGFEEQVLEGALGVLATGTIKAIALEAEARCDGGVKDIGLYEILAAHGYTVRRIRRPDGTQETRENYLAARMFPPKANPMLDEERGAP